jgi:hypothetical protein
LDRSRAKSSSSISLVESPPETLSPLDAHGRLGTLLEDLGTLAEDLLTPPHESPQSQASRDSSLVKLLATGGRKLLHGLQSDASIVISLDLSPLSPQTAPRHARRLANCCQN